jgi:MarR family transcriptional regulator, organic hydroperoxide resistance regulator
MADDRPRRVTSVASSPEGLRELIDDVAKANLRAWSAAGSRVKLLSGDLSALSRLVAAGSMTGLELGRAAGLPSSSVTDTADRLEQAGMIKRSRAREDRRVVVLRPTAKGRRAVDRALEPLHGALAAARRGRKRGELESAVGVLLDVRDALEAAAGPRG